MDREKLNKAAEEYAAFETEDYGDIDERTTAHDNCIYGFRRGVDWLMQQPLSERLTEEEKEKIKGLYKDFEQLEKRGASLSDRATGCSLCHLLTTIFGSDLFK